MPSIDRIIATLPDYFPKETSTNIYKILNSISIETDNANANVLYLDNLLEVNTTNGSDLDKIYGRLYDIARYSGEIDSDYRLRLNTAFLSQRGGTSEIIQYAIALVLGIDINDKVLMDNAINIQDAWIYDPGGSILPSNSFGCAVCILDDTYITGGINDTVLNYSVETVDRCKASGVNFFVIYISLNIDIDVNIGIIVDHTNITMAQLPIIFPTQFGTLIKEEL